MRPGSSLVCERVRAQISVGLDGELSQLERAMLGSHVTRCASCRAYETSVRAVTDALRSAPLEEIERTIVVPRRRRQLVTTRMQVGAAAAAAIAALIGSSELLRGEQIRIQPVFLPDRGQVKYPTQQQLTREQAILKRARVGRPVQIQGEVL